jgi:hypothetical protein
MQRRVTFDSCASQGFVRVRLGLRSTSVFSSKNGCKGGVNACNRGSERSDAFASEATTRSRGYVDSLPEECLSLANL